MSHWTVEDFERNLKDFEALAKISPKAKNLLAAAQQMANALKEMDKKAPDPEMVPTCKRCQEIAKLFPYSGPCAG